VYKASSTKYLCTVSRFGCSLGVPAKLHLGDGYGTLGHFVVLFRPFPRIR
jgi:hypothetical protein